MENEEWKPIWHAPNYEVSNFGRVRSLDITVHYLRLGEKRTHFCKGRIIKPYIHKKRKNSSNYYADISLSRQYRTEGGSYKKFRVHRLVAEAFIENPNNYPEVNHKDNNGLNNHVSNLEWVTSSMNRVHAFNIGAQPHGINHVNSGLTLDKLQAIRADLCLRVNRNPSLSSIAKKHKVGYGIVQRLNSGESYKRIT